MPAAADVCCAYTYVCIGQLSRTDAFSTCLTALLCVGASTLHSHLLTFTSPLLPCPSPRKVTVKVARQWSNSVGDMGPRYLHEQGRQEGTDDAISKLFFFFFKGGNEAYRVPVNGPWCFTWELVMIIPSSPMAWFATLPAHYDPLQRQMGHLQISCGDPNKVFHFPF